MKLDLLREKVKIAFDKAIDTQGPIALLDFPNYNNVGDSAIWLGEREYLKARGSKISYVASVAAFSLNVLKKTMPSGTILLHGGGNFGTLWPLHQQLRESVLRECRDYRVIQLPQSLHFDDAASFNHCSNLVKSHPDFTLMVRDHKSFDLGVKLGAKCILAPDAAHYLYGRLYRQNPEIDLLGLMRQDKERVKLSAFCFDAHIKFQQADWDEDYKGFLLSVVKEFERREHGRFGHLDVFQSSALFFYDSIAWKRVLAGIKLLSRGRALVTDRLHGHILASLIEVPHVVLDNSYGKVHGYINAWGSEWGMIANSIEEVHSISKSILKNK